MRLHAWSNVAALLLAAAFSTGGATPARAQDPPPPSDDTPSERPEADKLEANKATARQLFFDGHAAFNAGDWVRAEDLLGRSNTLYPAPTAALWHARSLIEMGRLLQAHEVLRQVVSSDLAVDAPEAFKNAHGEAAVEAAQLRPRIPALVIRVNGGAALRVTVDGVPIPTAALGVKRPVDPGTHHVAAVADGFLSSDRDVMVGEGAVVELNLTLQPDPNAKPAVGGAGAGPTNKALQTVGFGFIGAGGVALLAWGVTGALFLGEKGIVDEQCNTQHVCSQEGFDAAATARAYGVANTVSLLAGLALAGAGVAMVLVGDEAPDDGHEKKAAGPSALVMPSITPDGVGVSLQLTF